MHGEVLPVSFGNLNPEIFNFWVTRESSVDPKFELVTRNKVILEGPSSCCFVDEKDCLKSELSRKSSKLAGARLCREDSPCALLWVFVFIHTPTNHLKIYFGIFCGFVYDYTDIIVAEEYPHQFG